MKPELSVESQNVFAGIQFNGICFSLPLPPFPGQADMFGVAMIIHHVLHCGVRGIGAGEGDVVRNGLSASVSLCWKRARVCVFVNCFFNHMMPLSLVRV